MLAKANKNLKREGVFKMQNFQKQIGKKVLSCVIALLMVVSMLPFAAFTAFAETQGILFITDTITPDTKTVEVNIGQAVTGGFAKIIQIDGDEEYNPEKLFEYTGLSSVISYKDITEGSNTFSLES